ncbi:Protein ZBED8, partial [Trichinella sp. T8]
MDYAQSVSRNRPVFLNQGGVGSCDESTDQANCAQLIVYARFIANNTIEEELLFSEPLKTTRKGADVFQAVSQFFE